MNPNERAVVGEIDSALVRRLVAAQFPRWADLPVRPVSSQGWDNRTFRLGDEMSVRLPSHRRYVAAIEKEHAWLPRLAPHLPLPIPAPLAIGAPGEGYPWRWSINHWLEGETAAGARINDHRRFATDLAGFLAALQRIEAADGPPAGPHSFWRGGPLATYDDETRRAIAALGASIDAGAATAVWDAALAAWRGPPVWVHGDIAPGNLLVQDGRLSGVIDFGQACVGDPACDLAIAWTFFEGPSRAAFRAGLPLDAGTWARGRGWALWKALIVLAGLPGANPADADEARRIIGDVVADHRKPVWGARP
ncbi:MAG: aminoglycoside phosphotransferase family protein [Caulobacteraceae bacterium]